MNNILFFINYIFLPVGLSCIYVSANIKKENKTIMNFHLIKGIFSLYLVMATLIGIVMGDAISSRYAIGLAVSLGIMDSAISIVEGIKIGKNKRQLF